MKEHNREMRTLVELLASYEISLGREATLMRHVLLIRAGYLDSGSQFEVVCERRYFRPGATLLATYEVTVTREPKYLRHVLAIRPGYLETDSFFELIYTRSYFRPGGKNLHNVRLAVHPHGGDFVQTEGHRAVALELCDVVRDKSGKIEQIIVSLDDEVSLTKKGDKNPLLHRFSKTLDVEVLVRLTLEPEDRESRVPSARSAWLGNTFHLPEGESCVLSANKTKWVIKEEE